MAFLRDTIKRDPLLPRYTQRCIEEDGLAASRTTLFIIQFSNTFQAPSIYCLMMKTNPPPNLAQACTVMEGAAVWELFERGLAVCHVASTFRS